MENKLSPSELSAELKKEAKRGKKILEKRKLERLKIRNQIKETLGDEISSLIRDVKKEEPKIKVEVSMRFRNKGMSFGGLYCGIFDYEPKKVKELFALIREKIREV